MIITISRQRHQPDAFPEPGCQRPGKNVPAEGVGRLAQRNAAPAVPAAEKVLRVGLAQLLQQGGADVYPQDVPSAGDNLLRDVEFMGDKGIL